MEATQGQRGIPNSFQLLTLISLQVLNSVLDGIKTQEAHAFRSVIVTVEFRWTSQISGNSRNENRQEFQMLNLFSSE